MTFFQNYLQGQQAAQQKALQALRLQQMQRLGPIEAQLQQLALDRGKQQMKLARAKEKRESELFAADRDRGFAAGKESQKGQTVIVEKDGQLGFATSVFDPNSGQTEVSFAPIQGDLVSSLGETRKEQIETRVQESREKAIAGGLGKASATSIADKVSAGLVAADSTAVIRRSMDLLDEIKTGGFQSALIKAKQFAGVEGADEGELTFNLAKNVLSQLKTTFGAAFTQAEGDRLEKIEAGLGRSAEANKRILQQALKLAERTAARGIRAAERGGDDFLSDLEEIENSLEFDLAPVNESTVKPVSEMSNEELLQEYNRLKAQ